jgi:hypothetical protein
MRAAAWAIVAAAWAWMLTDWYGRIEQSERAAVAAVAASVRR